VDTLSYKTVSANRDTVQKEWVIVDAKDQVLGRFASRVAIILRGKHKSSFTPHVDCGDNVIIINAREIKLTGQKLDQKVYFRYSGYMGGQKQIPMQKLMTSRPDEIIMHAVKGMLPKNRLGRQLLTNLRVYAGPEHPHEAQQPKNVEIS